ncbi:MAG: hypothetical protein K2G44_02270 [Clostridia bacterium]|nr:hypothetical protein [Clostridia bacterium]
MKYDFRTDIVLIADDFYEAYKRCREDKNPVHEGNILKFSACHIPAIVNGAFSLELYFKSILPPKIYGHELKTLFDKLADDIKLEIREAVTPKLNNLAWQKSFEEYLEDINNVFVDWRYINEKDYAVDHLANRINEYLQIFEIMLPVVKEATYKYKQTIL